MNSPIDSLVLSGGSASGIIMLGKLYALETELDIDFTKLKIYAGTSVGAIICLLLIVGYSPFEMTEHLKSSPIWSKIAKSVFAIIRGEGVCSLSVIQQELSAMILHKVKILPRFCDVDVKFVCPSFDLDNQKIVYFDSISTPNMNILDAVIASCAIPFFFEPFIFENTRLIDGGIFDCFPLEKTWQLFAPKSIVALKCERKSSAQRDMSVWQFEDIFNVVFAVSEFNSHRQIELVSKLCGLNLFRLESNVHFFDLNMTPDRIADMFLQGFSNISQFE